MDDPAALSQRLHVARQRASELESHLRDALHRRCEAAAAARAAATEQEATATGMPPVLAASPVLRRELLGHFGKVYALHWGGPAEAHKMLSVSQDATMIQWDTRTGLKEEMFDVQTSWMMTCALEPTTGRYAACGGLDNVVLLFTRHAHESMLEAPLRMQSDATLAGHAAYVSCCRNIDAVQLLTSSGDCTCRLWDVETSACVQTFEGHGQRVPVARRASMGSVVWEAGDVMSISPCPTDAHVFVSGSVDATAKLWDTRTGRCSMTLFGHNADINAVDFLPNGWSFATGSDDSECSIFDIRACCEVRRCKSDRILSLTTCVAASKSGRLLFAGYDDRACRVWDLLHSEHEPVAELDHHSERVSCAGVSACGSALGLGSWDQRVSVCRGPLQPVQ